MSKLFEAIKKARKDGSVPTVIDTTDASPNEANGGAGAGAGPGEEGDAGTVSRRESDGLSVSVPMESRQDSRREPSQRPAPSVPDRHSTPEEHMVSLIDPMSFEAEQFRALRHIVEERQRAHGLRAVAVTSASEGDGKSLVSVNLAGALAQNRESRVLVVDCDLRAPALSRALGLRGSPAGLADVVSSATLRLDDVAIERSTYNLTVLSAGKTPSSPYEVLKSERFAALLDDARARFDFVIVDTPPVLAFPDTRIIEGHVDGVLLVVGAHKTPRKQVDEAVSSISEGKLLGLVFNGEDEPKRYASSTYYYRGKVGARTGKRRPFWTKRRR